MRGIRPSRLSVQIRRQVRTCDVNRSWAAMAHIAAPTMAVRLAISPRQGTELPPEVVSVVDRVEAGFPPRHQTRHSSADSASMGKTTGSPSLISRSTARALDGVRTRCSRTPPEQRTIVEELARQPGPLVMSVAPQSPRDNYQLLVEASR